MIQFLSIVFLCFSFLACTNVQKDVSVQESITTKPSFYYMYVKETRTPFHKGEKVKVYSVVKGIATTEKGEIYNKLLEKNRTEFQLTVETPNGKKIRILNIKSKYKDGIWLKRGKYHIEVSAKRHITYKKWIDLEHDTALKVALKRKKNISMGFIQWKEIKGLKYFHNTFWQDQPINKQQKMNWYEAKEYCKKMSLQVNKNIIFNNFELPTEKELFNLKNYTSRFDYMGSIYWSSSDDKQHKQFAQYVHVKKHKSGWYNKTGKAYVRCIAHEQYPISLPLQKLVKYFMIQEHYNYLDAYTLAVDVQYGKPTIRNIVRKKNHKVSFLLRSQKYDQNKEYFYYKEHILDAQKEIKNNPKIKFEIINNKLNFRGVY